MIVDTVLVKHYIGKFGWGPALAHSRPPHILVSIYMVVKYCKFNEPGHWVLLGFGCLGAFAPLITYYILSKIDISRFYPMTVIVTAIVVVAGFLILKEDMNWQKMVGIALALGATYLLARGGS